MTKATSTRLAGIGLLLQLALLVGIGGTITGMLRTFFELGADEDIAEAAGSITGGVAHALLWLKLSAPIALVGLFIVALATTDGGARERWVYRGTFCALILWCLLFPLGTIIGVVGLCMLIPRRKEFRNGGEPGVPDNLVSAPRNREASS